MIPAHGFPSTDRQARGRRILFQRRAAFRTKPVPPLAPIDHVPIGTVVVALTAGTLMVCGLVSTIAIAAYVFDPVRRPSTTVRADGGSAWTDAPLRGAAAFLPKIDDRVPQ